MELVDASEIYASNCHDGIGLGPCAIRTTAGATCRHRPENRIRVCANRERSARSNAGNRAPTLESLSALLAGTPVFNLDVSHRSERLDLIFAQEHATRSRDSVFNELKHDTAHEECSSPETEERIASLQRLIDQCQPRDRALLLLYLNDCSYREIAAVLDLTETNVATKMSRLKEHLRRKVTTNE